LPRTRIGFARRFPLDALAAIPYAGIPARFTPIRLFIMEVPGTIRSILEAKGSQVWTTTRDTLVYDAKALWARSRPQLLRADFFATHPDWFCPPIPA
jgi:hypothetical protein